MAAQLFYLPFRPAIDANALTVPGAQLYFYSTGTTTLISIFSDEALSTPLTNPVTANAAGVWPSIYFDDTQTVRVVLTDSDGATLDEQDPYLADIADDLTDALNTVATNAANSASAASTSATETAALLAGAEVQSALNKAILGSAVPALIDAFVEDVSINGGIPGRTYIPRFLIDEVGGQARLTAQIYDTELGEPVAYGGFTESGGWDRVVPRSFTIWGISAGSVLNNSSLARFVGLSATFWLNPAAADFTQNVNTLAQTDASVTRINTNRILNREQVRDMILNMDPIEEELITVGASGADFTRVQDAIASLARPGPESGRGQFPYTLRCGPTHQIRIRVIDTGHTEEWVDNDVDQGGGTILAQGMLMQMGMILELAEDTTLFVNGGNVNGVGCPLFESSFGGVIIGPSSARLEQRGDGYVIHNDANNAISIPALIGDSYQTFQIVERFEGPEIWAHAGHNDWMVGRGISDDEFRIFAPSKMTREVGSTTSSAFYGCHTSPANANGGGIKRGRIFVRDVIANDAEMNGPAFAFTTLPTDTAQTIQHEITFSNADIDNAAASVQYILKRYTGDGATALDGLSDVDLTTTPPTDGQGLVYDNSDQTWKPGDVGGGGGGAGQDGLGWTGGSYNAGTGVVTFSSDDGLGFSTGDLRGAQGDIGPQGVQGIQGIQGIQGVQGDAGPPLTVSVLTQAAYDALGTPDASTFYVING
ncbi:MAG: hypothetical protein MJH10_16105 [Epibacterium sp.]|nr:hypothetical protein [Epibacterium sp.]NQX75038.1 hypothetical protein [Epibacterium sp.]